MAEDDTSALDRALERPRDDLEAAKQEMLYAKAETQNVRRRMEKDVIDARNYAATGLDRKSVVYGKSVSVRVDLGVSRIIKKKKSNSSYSSPNGNSNDTHIRKHQRQNA